MDNTDFIMSKFSYIFSQPASPLSQYLNLDGSAEEDTKTEDASENEFEETEK